MQAFTKPLIIDEHNKCIWGTTPWDSRALKLNTAAVYNINYESRLEELLALIDQHNRENNIQLTYFRHDANDQLLKKIAVAHGFMITEMSLIAFHNDISSFTNTDPDLVITPLLKSDNDGLAEVQRITNEVFGHGRFHEDPHLDISLARKRFEYWIDDLTDSAMLHTYRENGRILGFFSFKNADGVIDIPLNGIAASIKGRGRSLMAATMRYIFDKTGVGSIKIQVSGANMAALNMYARMGFGFTQPTFGYHKYY
ncbi:MAG: GNAT family N-acetyltransferase [Acidobacteriota bacterium]